MARAVDGDYFQLKVAEAQNRDRDSRYELWEPAFSVFGAGLSPFHGEPSCEPREASRELPDWARL